MYPVKTTYFNGLTWTLQSTQTGYNFAKCLIKLNKLINY